MSVDTVAKVKLSGRISNEHKKVPGVRHRMQLQMQTQNGTATISTGKRRPMGRLFVWDVQSNLQRILCLSIFRIPDYLTNVFHARQIVKIFKTEIFQEGLRRAI